MLIPKLTVPKSSSRISHFLNFLYSTTFNLRLINFNINAYKTYNHNTTSYKTGMALTKHITL